MEALRRYLNRTGMSAFAFAQWMRPAVSGRTVQRWLSGEQKPKGEQIVEIYRLTKGDVRFEHWYPLPRVEAAE